MFGFAWSRGSFASYFYLSSTPFWFVNSSAQQVGLLYISYMSILCVKFEAPSNKYLCIISSKIPKVPYLYLWMIKKIKLDIKLSLVLVFHVILWLKEHSSHQRCHTRAEFLMHFFCNNNVSVNTGLICNSVTVLLLSSSCIEKDEWPLSQRALLPVLLPTLPQPNSCQACLPAPRAHIRLSSRPRIRSSCIWGNTDF